MTTNDVPGLEGLKILLVDDHADTIDMLAVMLGMSGAKVKTSATAREAFEVLKTWRPDLLVSDIGMPDEDGYALIGRIRNLELERGGATPALALTGYAGSEQGERVLAAGFQAHLVVPEKVRSSNKGEGSQRTLATAFSSSTRSRSTSR